MGLISGKLVLIVIALCVALGFSLATGLVKYGASDYECYGGKHWQKVGEPVPWLWLGKLKLLYQPYKRGCDKDHQYSPRQYHVVDGLLSPVQTPDSPGR